MINIKTEKTIDEKASLFQLAWPIFIEALLSLLIGSVDSLMLGRYSETAVGSVGNANQILNFLTLAFNIIASATGVVVAQYLGAKQKEKINEIYSLSFAFNIVISIVISVAVFLFSRTIFVIMRVPEEMLPDSISYMKLLGGFIFLQAIYNVFSQIFRSNGMTKVGMYISLLINILNIIGNYVFLYGPLKFMDLGVTGVAISSVFSRFVAILIACYFFAVKVDGRISIKYINRNSYKTLIKLIKIGIPSAGESISYSISQIILMSFVNVIGIVAVNTKVYASVLSNFSFLYSVAVGQATMIIVGHLVGAKKEDEAYKRVIKSLIPAVIISILIAAVNYALSPVTLGFFTDNKEVIRLGITIMAIGIVLEIGRSTNLVVINSMRASGDILFPTILGMISMWGVSVGIGYILGIRFNMGLVGIWIAMAMDEWVRAIAVLIRWIKGSWRGRNVIEK